MTWEVFPLLQFSGEKICIELLCVSACIQSCLTLCGPMRCNPPDSPIPGISQATIWSGLPFPSPRDLPDRIIKPVSPALEGGFLLLRHWGNSAALLILSNYSELNISQIQLTYLEPDILECEAKWSL